MSLNFQERFKNRRTQIDKLGNFELGFTSAVNKPSQSQIFDKEGKTGIFLVDDKKAEYMSPSKNLVSTPRSNKIADPIPRKQAHSAKPFRNVLIEDQQKPSSSFLPPVEEFKPYTLKDYQNIKPSQYYELGGLGPSSIGSDQWKQKKEVINRRNEYMNQVMLRRPNEKAKEVNSYKGGFTPQISLPLQEFERKK